MFICRVGCRRRRRRGPEFELAEPFDGDAESHETETGAEPGEEGAFGGEMVARCGAGVFEGGAAEAGKHFRFDWERERVDRTLARRPPAPLFVLAYKCDSITGHEFFTSVPPNII